MLAGLCSCWAVDHRTHLGKILKQSDADYLKTGGLNIGVEQQKGRWHASTFSAVAAKGGGEEDVNSQQPQQRKQPAVEQSSNSRYRMCVCACVLCLVLWSASYGAGANNWSKWTMWGRKGERECEREKIQTKKQLAHLMKPLSCLQLSIETDLKSEPGVYIADGLIIWIGCSGA